MPWIKRLRLHSSSPVESSYESVPSEVYSVQTVQEKLNLYNAESWEKSMTPELSALKRWFIEYCKVLHKTYPEVKILGLNPINAKFSDLTTLLEESLNPSFLTWEDGTIDFQTGVWLDGVLVMPGNFGFRESVDSKMRDNWKNLPVILQDAQTQFAVWDIVRSEDDHLSDELATTMGIQSLKTPDLWDWKSVPVSHNPDGVPFNDWTQIKTTVWMSQDDWADTKKVAALLASDVDLLITPWSAVVSNLTTVTAAHTKSSGNARQIWALNLITHDLGPSDYGQDVVWHQGYGAYWDNILRTIHLNQLTLTNPPIDAMILGDLASHIIMKAKMKSLETA
jgi:hypothetical protein